MRNYNIPKLELDYNDVSYHGVRSVQINPFQTSYHGVRRCVIESTSAWQFRQWQTGPLFHQELIPHLWQGFHCGHSGFRGWPVFSSVRRIVTFNNYRSLLFGFFMNTDISHLLDLFASLSSSREEIHEHKVNLKNSVNWAFFMSNTCSRYPSYPSQGYPSDANSSHKETKEVWTLQPKPSQLEEQPRLGATVQPYPVIMSRGLAGKLGLLEVFVHWASIISKNNQLDDFRMSFNEPISYTKWVLWTSNLKPWGINI